MAKFDIKDRKDRFYKKAKDEGRASRAFYKLEQIQQKYKIFKGGDRVVDLGCAPGGWMEYISKVVGSSGKILGVDLLPLKITVRPNMFFIQEDMNNPIVAEEVLIKLGKVDSVVSDTAPDTSGVKFRDSYLSYELALGALDIAKGVLKEDGNFVVKIFPGEEFMEFKKELQKHFTIVKQYRPEATRKTSNEIYLVGVGFKGL
jgi:23S rRNA (uridine2552-2'-O)-methyltransferase